MDITNKTGISPTQLGRERKRYEEMLLLEEVTVKQVESQMKLDAKRYSAKLEKEITFEDYRGDINDLAKPANSGKREGDKVERDNLIMETQNLNAVCNLAIQNHRGVKKLTDEQKIIAFDALGERATVLADHMTSAFDGFGALTMIHAPTGLLSVHISGWEDGSKTNRYQYAPRKVPVSKRSGYRDDSFESPIFKVVAPKNNATTGDKKPKPKGNGKSKSNGKSRTPEAEVLEAPPQEIDIMETPSEPATDAELQGLVATMSR